MVFVAVAVGSFVKGVTGSGLPLIGVPFMASFLGVEHAVVVMLLPSMIANGWIMWANREEAPQARHLTPFFVLGAAGATAGTWALVSFDDDLLSLALAAVIGAYAITFLAKPDLQFSRTMTDRLNAPVGLAAGLLQGATGVSGPVVVTYLHGFRMDRDVYLFSITSIYASFGAIQIIALGLLGSITMERLGESVLTLIPMAVALPLGMAISKRVSHRTFEYMVLALLVVVGLKLVWNGLS
ncbi:MAG: sulfite exporter TauE/SafE family protein [Acidimicrobiia bacterium]